MRARVVGQDSLTLRTSAPGPSRRRRCSPGGMRERPNRHAWRACVGQPTVGSNPTPSAHFGHCYLQWTMPRVRPLQLSLGGGVVVGGAVDLVAAGAAGDLDPPPAPPALGESGA